MQKYHCAKHGKNRGKKTDLVILMPSHHEINYWLSLNSFLIKAGRNLRFALLSTNSKLVFQQRVLPNPFFQVLTNSELFDHHKVTEYAYFPVMIANPNQHMLCEQ